MSNITLQTVTYPNLGWDVAADLYLPPGFDDKKQYPAIVSTHPIGSCKEQTAGNIYAKGLAEAGFVVLVHDASFQGASGGTPRFIEDPAIRVSDIRFAIDYLQSLPYVDAGRIGAIGVCGGGAYTVHAAITDHRIRDANDFEIRRNYIHRNPVSAHLCAGSHAYPYSSACSRLHLDEYPCG